jgi:hypothetical protein
LLSVHDRVPFSLKKSSFPLGVVNRKNFLNRYTGGTIG